MLKYICRLTCTSTWYMYSTSAKTNVSVVYCVRVLTMTDPDCVPVAATRPSGEKAQLNTPSVATEEAFDLQRKKTHIYIGLYYMYMHTCIQDNITVNLASRVNLLTCDNEPIQNVNTHVNLKLGYNTMVCTASITHIYIHVHVHVYAKIILLAWLVGLLRLPIRYTQLQARVNQLPYNQDINAGLTCIIHSVGDGVCGIISNMHIYCMYMYVYIVHVYGY